MKSAFAPFDERLRLINEVVETGLCPAARRPRAGSSGRLVELRHHVCVQSSGLNLTDAFMAQVEAAARSEPGTIGRGSAAATGPDDVT
ncbi:MAG: hypothetical protein WKF78_11990 [Candidatus Limnocylindrales bacterium]